MDSPTIPVIGRDFFDRAKKDDPNVKPVRDFDLD